MYRYRTIPSANGGDPRTNLFAMICAAVVTVVYNKTHYSKK